MKANKEIVRDIDKVIIHCSDTYHNMDVGVEEIRRWHLARNFSDIGYHYVIRRDGTIEEGRDINKSGAHCRGQNRSSIGCCFVGGKAGKGAEADNFTLAQLAAGRELMKAIQEKLPHVTFHGHNEFSSKQCPVLDINLVIPQSI